MARLRATTNQNKRRVEATGKRTGVSILSQEIQVQPNGFEDPDAFFSQARSPSFTEKENPRNQIKTTRFSVGSLQQHQDDVSTSTGQTKRMMGRIKGLTSPSELSRVSTAPASPESVARQKQQHREDPIVDSPGPIMNDDDEYDDEIEEQVRQQSPIADEREEEEEEQQPLIPEATKDDDDTVNGESSIVEDDFMPPRPPDSPERDDESEIPTRTDNHADIPTQMSADEEGVDEDEDGPGYSMPSSKTPESAKIIRKEKKESKKKDKVSNKNESKKRKKAANETMSDDDSEQKPKKKIIAQRNKKSRYATYFSPKGIPLPMEYESVPVDRLRNTQEVEVNGKPCRRSKRARCSPLAFWKNEKLEYGPNDDLDATSDLARMPIPKAVIKAKETPYKPRTVRPRVVSASAKKKTKAASVPVEEAPMLKFDSRKLRKKYEYVDDEQAVLWDEDTEESQKMKIVAYNGNVQYRKLPAGQNRTKAEGNVVGRAAQAFNIVQAPDSSFVGYIMGNLALPPKGIKDAESVGSCAQTFTIVSGQPGAIEIAYADPDEDDNGTLKPETAIRFLLGPGDMFRVPPGNCYRLQNHSKTTECFMTWTIIRPHASSTGE